MNRYKSAAMGSSISPLIANIFMEECEVKSLNSFPHPLPSGSGLLMTPLSSTRQTTVRTYSSISTTRTHTYSLQWNQHNKSHFSSWTLLSPRNQTTPSAPQYTGNPPTQINIYIGTATTTSQQNIVSSTPWHTGPKQFLHPRIKWTGNYPNQHTTSTSNNNSPADNNKNKATIIVPYIPNTGEKFKKLCKKKGIQVHFKGTNT